MFETLDSVFFLAYINIVYSSDPLLQLSIFRRVFWVEFFRYPE